MHLAVHAVILGVVSAIVSLLQTWAVQRFGGIYGGVIGTIPIVIVPASIVLSIDETPYDFEVTLFCAPMGVLLNIALLLVWRNFPMRFLFRIQHKTLRMSIMVIGSILAWTIMAVIVRFIIEGLAKLKISVHYPALAAFAIQVFVAMFVIVFGDRFTSKGEGKVKWKLYVMAGVLGFITGVGLVFLSVADDTSGGLLLSFPIILILSLSSLTSAYAETLPITATTAMICGSVSTSLYAIIFAQSLPLFDRLFQPAETSTSFKPAAIVVATIVCWICCLLIISLPVTFILRCLARREKDNINRVDFGSSSSDPQIHDGFDTRLTAGWDTAFGSDDEEDSDGLTSESSSLLSQSKLTNTSFTGPSLHSESNTAARRAILEESMGDESPILFNGVGIPDSPVPNGSSRLSPMSSSKSSKGSVRR